MVPEFLEYGFMQRAFLVGIVTALICPAIGVFLVPRRLSLIADTLAHVALAGVAVGLVLGVPPLAGALVVTTAGAIGIERLRTRGALAGDASLAVFLSGGLAVAVVLIGVAGGFNVDLFALLFGSILTVSVADVALIVGLGIAVGAALAARYASLVAITVNEDLARTSGVPVGALNLMMAILTAFTTIVAMRMVGVLLVSAMIVLPTLVGFALARSFRGALQIATAVAVAAVVIGLVAAYYLRLAAGASIVLVALLAFGLARIVATVRDRPRQVAAAAAGALVVIGLAGSAAANPFALPPKEGRDTPRASEPAPPPPARPVAPRGPESASTLWPAPVQRVLAEVTTAQRSLNASLAREMRRIRETGAMGAILTVAGISFVYGVLHAVGPGHGKLVVSSFLLARDATVLGGVVLSGLISLVQVFTSVALVAILGFVLGERGLGVLDRSVWLELVSYGAIVAIGCYMAWSAVTGRDLHHHHGAHAHGPPRTSASMIVAAGLTPCASAIILMLFALANGVFLIGLVASVVMAVGMGITVALVGVVTILGRRSIVSTASIRPRLVAFVRRGLAMTGAGLVIVIGGLFFASAWTRLP